jgi:hypothetical protein
MPGAWAAGLVEALENQRAYDTALAGVLYVR